MVTMDPLEDWHRYVDQLSRPVTRKEPGPEDRPRVPWRPWMERRRHGSMLPDRDASLPDAPEVADALPPGIVPELAELAPQDQPAPCHPATRRFRDLTVHDQLEPIPLFEVPRFEAPSLDFSAPRIREVFQPDVEPPARQPGETATQKAPADDYEPSSPGIAPPAPAAGSNGANGCEAAGVLERSRDEALDAGEPPRDRLNRLRRQLEGPRDAGSIEAQEVAQKSYKIPFQESREALLQRLLDPELTLEETARLLDVCPTTVRRWTNKGVLRHFRTPGNQRRFRLSDVLEMMERRRTMSAAELEESQPADPAAR